MDGDLTTKVARKNGGKSHLAITRLSEIATIIDARCARKEPSANRVRDM